MKVPRPRGKAIKRPEQALQIAVAELLDRILDRSETFWFHPPQGGGRSKVEGGILKAMGSRAGMPDIVIFHNPPSILDDGLRVFGIELKVKNTTSSDVQIAMHERLRRAGIPVAEARSLEEVLFLLRYWDIPHLRTTILPGGGYITGVAA